MTPRRPLVPQGPQLIAPATFGMVALTLALAFFLTLLPWPDPLRWVIPDFTLMALLYWHVQAPRLAGVGMAFALGLLTDTSHGVLIGQHALSYSLSAYIALSLHRRLENFPLFGRALHLAPILFGQVLLVLLLGLWLGQAEVDWRYLAGGLASTLLWLPTAMLLDRITGRPSVVLAESEDA